MFGKRKNHMEYRETGGIMDFFDGSNIDIEKEKRKNKM